MTAELIPFRELRFGRLDAHDEATNEPELLLEGFFDFESAATKISQRGKFLLLGTKGAGKSAVLEHLRLRAKNEPTVFFNIWDLREFPIADVRNMKTGQSPGLGRTQNSWEFLLLLRVLDSLYEDQSVEIPSELALLREALIGEGLLVGGWKTKILDWSKATVKVGLPNLGAAVELSNSSVHLFHVVEVIKRLLPTASVSNPHTIALDGLDSLLLEVDNEWESLGGLVQATESLNRLFRNGSMPIGVVLALRSDIYNVLSSPESNKFRDYAVDLNWSSEGASSSSPLWDLMEAKANVGLTRPVRLVSQYLGGEVPVSGRGATKRSDKSRFSGARSQLAPDFILNHTRFLPRDLVAILTEIQRAYDRSGDIPGERILQGVTRYCETYFEGEVFNNLAGILPRAPDAPRKIASFRDAMRTVDSRFFSFDELTTELEGEVNGNEVTSLLRQMFEVGAIGVRTAKGHTNFVYRKFGGSGFTKRHGFVLHNALARAWNIPWWE